MIISYFIVYNWIQFISQVMVDNNSLIVQHLYGSHNCAMYMTISSACFLAKAFHFGILLMARILRSSSNYLPDAEHV